MEKSGLVVNNLVLWYNEIVIYFVSQEAATAVFWVLDHINRLVKMVRSSVFRSTFDFSFFLCYQVVMIPDIQNKKEEIRKIWLEHWNSKTTSQIYKEFLGVYFDVNNYSYKHPDFLFFIQWAGKWKKEIEESEILKADDLSDEDILDIQDGNRKRMVLIMSSVLKKYEKDPKKMENIPIEEVRRLYKAIQSIEESIKRTKIAKGKLGLDTAKALILPYQRLSPEDLLTLRDKLNESIGRILKIKSQRALNGAGQDSSGNR